MDQSERAALEHIAAQQQEALRTIRENGFVFTDIGRDPGNWQHLAFSLYTTICEIDSVARAAIAAGDIIELDSKRPPCTCKPYQQSWRPEAPERCVSCGGMLPERSLAARRPRPGDPA